MFRVCCPFYKILMNNHFLYTLYYHKEKQHSFYLAHILTVDKKTKVSSLNDCPKTTDGVTASFRIKTKKLIIPLLIFWVLNIVFTSQGSICTYHKNVVQQTMLSRNNFCPISNEMFLICLLVGFLCIVHLLC